MDFVFTIQTDEDRDACCFVQDWVRAQFFSTRGATQAKRLTHPPTQAITSAIPSLSFTLNLNALMVYSLSKQSLLQRLSVYAFDATRHLPLPLPIRILYSP